MKTIKFTTLFILALLAASVEGVNAQSLLDFIKEKVSSPASQQTPTAVEKINKDALAGVWNYSGVAVEFTGTDLVSKLGSTVAAPSIKQTLDAYFAEAGIVKGSCSVEFTSKDTFIAKTARSSVSGLYKFDHQSQTVIITYNYAPLGGENSITGRLTFAGQKLNLTFSADKILEIIRELTREKQLDQNLNDLITIISEYKGLYLGIELEK
jgi:hypothetical protein